jgi:hypothetical protein
MATELKSYTIVPDSLYVERKADIQLHSIIEAMQRPGYVLVSRQMGKTNLLLRAKRKWENSRDLYVYIDMSNIDETEKECFQSLIDTAIDTHEDVLGKVRERIQELRRTNITKSAVQAHNEELRLLLGAIDGKLVFILDEIDSLTRTSFSDNVFSQIRSVYFSRINYPVLEKLTYVLSGVVEPTDIIKNPKISPFNIGEKILLDDFSHLEYMSFIQKTGLDTLGDTVLERIYYWTGGNPRMTWDVCYELQNRTSITVETVDTLVKTMYLTTFDKAPVDTIRNLVKEDRDLRDAIIQLVYDKGNALSDKIKSKLYLAGIVNYYDDDVRVKNRIIKDSLSLSWLQKIEEEEKGLLTYAIELHGKGFYADSLNRFETYLKNNDFPEENAPYYYYYMGSCCYHLKDYKQSLHFFTIAPIGPKMSLFDYRNENFLSGADCLKLGKYAESLAFFNNVMRGDERDWYYYSSKLNSLSAKMRLSNGDADKLEEVEKEYRDILALPEEPGIDGVKLYAAYQLAGLFSGKDNEEAARLYDQAMALAAETDKPRILSDKFYVVAENDKPALLKELVSSVERIQSLTDTLEPDKALGIDEEVLAQALFLIYSYTPDSWDAVRGKMELLPYTYCDSLFIVFQQSFIHPTELFGEGASRLIGELHDILISQEQKISDDNYLEVFKYNAFLRYTDDGAREYLTHLRNSSKSVDSIGLLVVRSYAWRLFDQKDYRSIINEFDWILDRYNESLSHQDAVPRALFEYCLLMSYFLTGDRIHAQDIATLILTYIDEEIKIASERNKDTLTQIKDAARQVLARLRSREPVRNVRTYGRNDRVKVKYLQSGSVVIKKYKQAEDDLKKGRCIVVEE